MECTKKHIRQLKRLKDRLAMLKLEHKGNEDKYTYWGAWDIGYLQGRISAIEDMLDDLGVDFENI